MDLRKVIELAIFKWNISLLERTFLVANPSKRFACFMYPIFTLTAPTPSYTLLLTPSSFVCIVCYDSYVD